MRPAPADTQEVLYDHMMHMVGLIFGVLLTGVLLTLGVSSVFLLSSKGVRGSTRRFNRFLCAYVIILLLNILAFDAEVFILGNGSAIFPSLPPNEIQKLFGIWGKAVGSTTLVIGLMADGILVSSSWNPRYRESNKCCFKVWRCLMVQRALGPFSSSKWGNIFWVFPACLWVLMLGMKVNFF